jgi:hypothetical protein
MTHDLPREELAHAGTRRFLFDLINHCAPDAVERTASLRFPRPPAEDVVGFMSERIAAGLFAEQQVLDLPAALIPSFVVLGDELDWSVRTGVVARWLKTDVSNHAFTVDFVRHLVHWLGNILDPHRGGKHAA